jgi:hypothetical protein
MLDLDTLTVSAMGIKQRCGPAESHLSRLGRFIPARMLDKLHLQEFILGQLDFHKSTDLWRAANDAEQQLRGAVSPMDAQLKTLSTYFIEFK